MQTALPSASRGRNGGGNVELVTRSGGDRFSGSARLLLPAREDERQRVLPEPRRRREAGVPPQRYDRHARRAAAPRPHDVLRRGRSASGFKSGYASNANAATGLPTGLTDTRNADDDRRRRQRVAAHRRAGRPAVRAELHERAARVPGRSAGRPHREVLRRSGAADVPRADARRHPSRRAEHPERRSATAGS